MLDMRAQWRNGDGAAFAGAAASGFGRRRKRWRDIDLIVDLGEEPLSKRWWRGVATLSALCASVAVLAPAPFEALPASQPDRVGAAEAEQYREIAIAPLAQGSRTGGRMAGTSLVEPLAQAPDRPAIATWSSRTSGSSRSALTAAMASSAYPSRSSRSIAEAGDDSAWPRKSGCRTTNPARAR